MSVACSKAAKATPAAPAAPWPEVVVTFAGEFDDVALELLADVLLDLVESEVAEGSV